MSKKYLDFTGLSTLVSLIRNKFATKEELEDYTKKVAPLDVYTIPSEYDTETNLDSNTIESLASYVDLDNPESKTFSVIIDMYDTYGSLTQTIPGILFVDYMKQGGEVTQINVSTAWLDIDAESYSLSVSFDTSLECIYDTIIRYKSLSYVDSDSPAGSITSEDILSWNDKPVFRVTSNDLPTVEGRAIDFSQMKRGNYFFEYSDYNSFYYRKDSNTAVHNIPNIRPLVLNVYKDNISEITSGGFATLYYVKSSGAQFVISSMFINSGDISTTGRINNVYFINENNQTIKGVKTFNSIPKISNTVSPTDNYELTNKKYVDDKDALKQNVIDSTHKLDADLVDDTNSTNKFVTSTEKTTWNGKQDSLTAGNNITIQNNVISASGGDGVKVYFVGNDNENINVILENLELGSYIFRNKNNSNGMDFGVYFKANEQSSNSVFQKVSGSSILHYFKKPSEVTASSERIGVLYLYGVIDLMTSKYGNSSYDIAYVKTNDSLVISTSYAWTEIINNSSNQTITGKKTFTTLPESSVVPTTNNQLVNKKYVDDSVAGIDLSSKQDTMQYSTMPTASAETVGKMVQYTGTTDATYTNGYFYIGTSDGEDPATYSWENINIQEENNVFDIGDKGKTTSNPLDLRTLKKGVYISSTEFMMLKFLTIGNGIINTSSTNYLLVLNIVNTYNDNLPVDTLIGEIIDIGNNALIKRKLIKNANGISVGNAGYGSWVGLDSNQTISGVKTFNSLPLSSVTPTDNSQLTNKSYVDGAISSAVGSINTVLATLTTPSQNSGGGE